MATDTSRSVNAIKTRSSGAGNAPIPPAAQQSIMDIMKRRRLKGELKNEYEKSENRRLDLENRFGHFLPYDNNNQTFSNNHSLVDIGGSSLLLSYDTKQRERQRPRTANSLNLSFSANGQSVGNNNNYLPFELSLPETNSSLLPTSSRNRNTPPPIYPQHKHMMAQPNYQLGSSRTMSYYDNARSREKEGVVGTEKITTKLTSRYASFSANQMENNGIKNYRRQKSKLINRKLPTISNSVNSLPTLDLKLPISPTTDDAKGRKMNSPLQGFENLY